MESVSTDTSDIQSWRSIITLIVFVLTNIVVLHPFGVPIPVPCFVYHRFLDTLSTLRIISPRNPAKARRGTSLSSPVAEKHDGSNSDKSHQAGKETKLYVMVKLPFNIVTAPLIADLFLLAISAIGQKEVHDGTVGTDNIHPIDIMAFFITLAYVAISIDASGLIRYLAFKVLQWGGKVGYRLFFYLYTFFFLLGSFIGNDPIILSGTAFLAYMTRVSSNIKHPRAWIHTQFAIANIASAILVSSNPTNLVLAGAFKIKFIVYTANMIVPVVVTAIVLFPFLLYIVFADEKLIPISITMHELSPEARKRKPVNPNIPHARGTAEQEEENQDEHGKLLSLEEIMNPFLDKKGAAVGGLIMAAALICILAVNASSQNGSEVPVFYITVPAAFVMFIWDLSTNWLERKKTREIAQAGREAVKTARAERERLQRESPPAVSSEPTEEYLPGAESLGGPLEDKDTGIQNSETLELARSTDSPGLSPGSAPQAVTSTNKNTERKDTVETPLSLGEDPQSTELRQRRLQTGGVLGEVIDAGHAERTADTAQGETDLEKQILWEEKNKRDNIEHPTVVSFVLDKYTWCQETFPTVTAVLAHLPFALVPFALSMFVLVQALVTRGWVPVFAYGWYHWVQKTGTWGAVGGMGFLSVILCNFAGTNIGTTILLSRVIQSWVQITINEQTTISQRTFWATVYSMAIGVNYGAFSAAFSASLAGLLWRDILERKHIHVKPLEFARVNLPIIAVSMVVGCLVLVGEVYIVRSQDPYIPA